MIKRPGMNIIQIACWGGGGGVTPGISWWWCAARFSKSWTSFRPKKCHFPHPFSDLASKLHTRVVTKHNTIHVCTEINYVIIADIKIATKRLLKIPRQNPFRFRIFHFLIYLELKRPNTLIHNRNSFVNHTRFHGSKWAKSITALRSDQNGAKTLPSGAAHTCMAYIREYPPGSQHWATDVIHQIYFVRDDWAYYLGTSHHRALKISGIN